MRALYKAVILLLFFTTATASALEPPWLLHDNMEQTPSEAAVQYLRDPDGSLSISDIVEDDTGRLDWQTGSSGSLNFGYTDSTFWIRLPIRSIATDPNAFVLHMPYFTLDEVVFYYPTPQGYRSRSNGFKRQIGTKDIRQPSINFALYLPRNAERTYYLRIRTDSSMNIPVSIIRRDILGQHIASDKLLNGLLYGIAAIMVLYNLIFYLFLKQRSFLYYVLAIGCYLIYLFSIGGILYEYFSDPAPWLFQGRFRNLGPFFGAMGMFWGIKFTSSFLELKQHSRRLYTLLSLAIIPTAVFFVTTLLFHYRITALVGNTTAIIWMLAILTVSSIRVLRGSIQARYFLVVHGVLILGITLHSLQALGILPYTILTARSNQLGFALSSVVLSIGLAHSVHRTLEKRVIERTRLQQLVTRISTDFANADSFSIDGKIQRFLQTTGRFFETDRAYMFRLSEDLSSMQNTHEWCTKELLPAQHHLQNFDLDKLPWWRQQLTAKQPIKIPYIPHMPDRANEERTLLLRQGIHSLLAIPVIAKDTHLIGFFGYVTIYDQRDWSESELNSLQILAHIIAHAQTKAEAERDLITAKLNAESANEAKSHFLANMTHEIRTPLNGVIGFTDLLIETDLTQQQKIFAEKANAAGHSLLELVSDILDYSKIEAGKLELESIPTDILHLMAEAVNLVEFQAENKKLELKLNTPRSLSVHAMVDPVRLRQILVNLLSNAVKFTHKGEVELSLKAHYPSPEQVHLNFSVRDTGIGIAPEQHKSLFEPFTQADTSTTRMYGGTGLGLTISHRLAKEMGTQIEVSSQVGSGSIFSFSLVAPVPHLHL